MVTNGGRFDWAIWDPISGRSTQANRVDRMTIHTAVTSSSDIYGPGKGPGGTYAHFYNPLNSRIRQHQEIHHKAYADLNANGYVVAVEHQDNAHETPLSDSQIDDDARLFAHLVTHYGTPNRIATVDNTKGLAWHRLGIDGNFGAYSPSDRTTWCKKQTGQSWSNAFGKLCPYSTRIRQIDEIYKRAQTYLGGSAADTTGDDTEDTQPTPKPDTGGDEDMPHESSTGYTGDHDLPADGEWRTLTIGQTDAKKNVYTLVTGPALATGTLSVVVKTAKPVTEVDVRTVHVDTKSGEAKTVYTGFPLEQFTQGGDTQIVLPFTERVRAADTGWVRNLRFEIKAYGGEKFTVKDARARSLYWPS